MTLPSLSRQQLAALKALKRHHDAADTIAARAATPRELGINPAVINSLARLGYAHAVDLAADGPRRWYATANGLVALALHTSGESGR